MPILASSVPVATSGAPSSRTPLCEMQEDVSVQPYAESNDTKSEISLLVHAHGNVEAGDLRTLTLTQGDLGKLFPELRCHIWLHVEVSSSLALSSDITIGRLTFNTAPAHEKYSRSGYLYFDTIGDSDKARATVGTNLARVALLSCSN